MRARLARALSLYLGTPGRTAAIGVPTDIGKLAAVLRPGDVILVEGTSRASTAIKYLPRSTGSHAALYVGPMPCRHAQGLVPSAVEADISEGVRAVPLSAFGRFHCRIYRPVGLKASDVNAVCQYAIGRVGEAFDLKNVLNLARSLIPAPPVPQRWRRKLLALDSGDPTRALCSTLIAQAFQSLQHPILPSIKAMSRDHPYCHDGVEQVLHVRHHCLFAPRDFDVSPYF